MSMDEKDGDGLCAHRYITSHGNGWECTACGVGILSLALPLPLPLVAKALALLVSGTPGKGENNA